jgi:phosphoribosyl-ATP pyrophosphohydrolase
MRGEAQIRAAARDDQETAQRNGNKKDWRREKLGTLLDKLEEEVKEFKQAMDEEDREGIRLEGSDVRWTVTMIQSHHGVLEIEEGVREEEMACERCLLRIQQLEEALRDLRWHLAQEYRTTPNDYEGFGKELIEEIIDPALSRGPSEAKEDTGE